MSLQGVREGDLIRVDCAFMMVRKKEKGRLWAEYLGSGTHHWVRAREVEAHWSRRGVIRT